MSLNFYKGIPLAKVIGGKHNGEILYIDDTAEIIPDEKQVEFDDEILNELIFSKMKGKNRENIARYKSVMDHLKKDVLPSDYHTQELYKKSKQLKDDKKGKEVYFSDASLQMIPNPLLERQTLYISGVSGSGKSTFIKNYVAMYKKLYPKRQIILFSQKESDPALDDIKNLIRIKIDNELVEDPINCYETFKDAMVIFDDVDAVGDKKIKNAIDKLKEDCLQNGRDHNIETLITSHNVSNGLSTRTILRESMYAVLFKSGPQMQTKYYLMRYLGFSKQQSDRALSLPSRWFAIRQHAPMVVIYEKGAYII
jgi:hypothetical protein